ncbi:uncharacterized protein LOC124165617 [Ischnura elegans]|uniref:uncharacterized protein LOC124165617 n=1 Tax=Ischnura elegans TaxID=197161 RepID=UPI001ED8881E|nr:uncharacterized protein LOC124165617 [Ischnura elegans]
MDAIIDFGCDAVEINRIFTCPGCKLRINPPVRQCRRGHLLCRKCFLRANRCPVCKGHLDRERNFTIESLARVIRFPCSYADYGCGEPFMPAKERVSHESTCPHRPFKCFVHGCEWMEEVKSERPCDPSTVAVLSKHIETKHPNYLPFSRGGNLSLKLNPSQETATVSSAVVEDRESDKEEEDEPQNKLYVLDEDGKLFLAKLHLQKCFGEVFLVVSVTELCRPSKESPGHHFSVHVRGGDCEMFHKAPVLSYMLSRGETESRHNLGLKAYQGVIYSGKYTNTEGDLFLDFNLVKAQKKVEKKSIETKKYETVDDEQIIHLE